MKDFIEDSGVEVRDLRDGMEFLIERELLARVAGSDDAKPLFGVTEEGLRALYMLGLVMASGVTDDEIHGRPLDLRAARVSRCAKELIQALDACGA